MHEILRLPAIRQRTGLGKTAIYARIKTGAFPAGFPLGKGARARGWLAEEIERWIAKQAQQREAATRT